MESSIPHFDKVILLVQLGSPESLTVSGVRKYLREFLADPRVVDYPPRPFWLVILYLFILPFRPFKTLKLYKNIVLPDGSLPLVTGTEDFAKKLRLEFKSEELNSIEIRTAYLLGKRKVREVLGEFNCRELLVVPMFPQYSESTTASVFDLVMKALEHKVLIPKIKFIRNYHHLKSFNQLSAKKIEKNFESNQWDTLVLSFHGIPKRRVISKGDFYYDHCVQNYVLIKSLLPKNLASKCHLSFQSRFGSEEWLTPSTEEKVIELAKSGAKSIAVYCPSFLIDCLETLEEIGMGLEEKVHSYGTKVSLIPCLNDDGEWSKNFADYLKVEFGTNDFKHGPKYFDELFYKDEEIKQSCIKEFEMSEKLGKDGIPPVEYDKQPLSQETKGTLKIVFLTLFLDLVGFSIIFPLFPALAKYYMENDGQNIFLNLIFKVMAWTAGTSFLEQGQFNSQSLVLFGGILGSFYSLLQFFASTFWGSLSDKIGRRPILLLSIFGLAISYGLWIFAGSFTLLVLSRFIGGFMAGNISTATATVADITSKENRSKGMAFIGIAFALGFILGPAIGGISGHLNLLQYYPNLERYGINPFSMAGIVAFTLSFINFLFVLFYFKETNKLENRERATQSDHGRSVNPVKLFRPLPYKGANLTNFGHFLFLAAFSGMEFTLTFLAFERLQFTPMQNASMFVFVGFIIALVQGGYVRRKAATIGERKMALQGLITVIPGLFILAYTQSKGMLYFGLFFLAVGSAMTIPCLTALASLYAPDHEQGRVMGVFRSLGALARVIGPLLASLAYWNYGGSFPYIVGGIFLLLPLFLVSRLPKPEAAI